MFDQRGAGYSTPDLNCYNLEFELDEETELELPGGINERQARTLASCAQAFAERGVDLTQYNTAENAKDVIDLASAVGLKSFNLSGVSYGTRLAQEVMRLNPPGLRSALLDSSLSPATRSYEDFYTKGWETLQGIFADCAADAACNRAFPNLSRRAAALVKKLDASPAHVVSDTLDFQLTGYGLLKPLILSHDVPQVAPYVPLMIDEVERGKYDTFLAIEQGAIPALPGVGEGASEPRPLDPDSPAGRFDATVVERINDLPEEDGNKLRGEYYGLFNPIQGRAALRDFAVRNFSGDDAARLLGLLAGLSDGELEDFYRANKPIMGSSRELGVFKAFECHDSYLFNDYDRVVSNARALPFAIPEDVLESTRLTMQECQFWPTGIAEKTAVQPVSSRLPTLILHGRDDFVTPLSWSKQVKSALRNSRLVEIGQAGHGALKYSACARDIAAQFVKNPKARLDTRCIASTDTEFRAP